MHWYSSGTIRRMCGILGAITIMAMLAACGGSGGNSSGGGGSASAKGPKNNLVACPTNVSNTAAASESGKVTLVVSTWGADPSEIKLDQDSFNSFMQKYPNITINYQPIPQNYDQKMQANVASGNVPDVFYVDQNMAQTYIPAGKLLNMSPYMTRDNVNPNDYYASLQHDFDCADGTVFGIPKDFGTLGLVYNKTMFQAKSADLQAAGVNPDPSNWTWDDVTKAAKVLTTTGPNGKVYGISTSADPARWMAFLYAAGGNVLSADGKSAVFNSQAGIDSATWYTGFKLAGTGVMPGDIGAGWNGDAFGKQQVAMTFEGGWMVPFMTASYPNVQYGIAPMPKDPTTGQRGDLEFTNAWGAYSGTKHPDAAAKLVEWMTSKTVQTNVLHVGFAMPTLKTIVQSEASWLNESTPLNANTKQLLDNATYGHSWFYGLAQTEVTNDTGNALQAIMLGKSSVSSALNDAATKVNNWIQQNE
jgi:multiple sugar transport system substrate-binding protein